MKEPPDPHASLVPTTTIQEDLTTAGQRKVNLIWEYTQASIAIVVIFANVVVASLRALGITYGLSDAGEYPSILQNALFLIVGFYFSRTNHAAIGGVGIKPQSIYQGR